MKICSNMLNREQKDERSVATKMIVHGMLRIVMQPGYKIISSKSQTAVSLYTCGAYRRRTQVQQVRGCAA